MFEKRRAVAEDKLMLAAAAAAATTGGRGGGRNDDVTTADPVSLAVIRSLDAKLETIDDLIARLEIEEGEVSQSVRVTR